MKIYFLILSVGGLIWKLVFTIGGEKRAKMRSSVKKLYSISDQLAALHLQTFDRQTVHNFLSIAQQTNSSSECRILKFFLEHHTPTWLKGLSTDSALTSGKWWPRNSAISRLGECQKFAFLRVSSFYLDWLSTRHVAFSTSRSISSSTVISEDHTKRHGIKIREFYQRRRTFINLELNLRW